jgi:hypothetical protein
MKTKFSPEQVHQEMVNYFIKKKIAIAVRGKGTVVPTSVDDLSPRIKKPTRKNTLTGKVGPNKEYVAARNRLHYRASKTPKVYEWDIPSTSTTTPAQAFKQETMLTPREERVENNNTISITLPSGMSATDLIDLIAIIRKSGAKCSL